MEEEWKDIPGFPGYKISSWGRVRGIRVNLLKPQYTARGGNYPFVDLRGRDAEGKKKRWLAPIHVLVAKAFLGPRPLGMYVHHKDHNRQNAWADNLEYVTPAHNRRF